MSNRLQQISNEGKERSVLHKLLQNFISKNRNRRILLEHKYILALTVFKFQNNRSYYIYSPLEQQ